MRGGGHNISAIPPLLLLKSRMRGRKIFLNAYLLISACSTKTSSTAYVTSCVHCDVIQPASQKYAPFIYQSFYCCASFRNLRHTSQYLFIFLFSFAVDISSFG